MRPLERNLLRFSAYALILFVIVALFMPVYACGCKVASPRYACLSNLKHQGTGLIQYAADNDERFPARDLWMDSILPYVKEERILHDPEASKGVYGYAFNAALSGAKESHGDAKIPLAYDSVNPIRNASDRLASLPATGKHKGQNNVVYADGHAKSRLAGEAS